MKNGLISHVAALAVFSALLLLGGTPACAAMCGKCRDLMFVDSQGKCIDCGAPTASGGLQLCPKCSVKRHQCEHCLAKLTATEEAATEPEPENTSPAPLPGPALPGDSTEQRLPAFTSPQRPSDPGEPSTLNAAPSSGSPAPTAPPASINNGAPLPGPASTTPSERPDTPKIKPIHPARPGTYTSGKWRFQMQITDPGARNEGRWGWLTYDGQKLPRGNVNDYYITPWGPMYWVGAEQVTSGLHGFMPVPLSQGPRQGKSLVLPANLVAPSTATPTATATTTPAAAPAPAAKVQTLEITRSHNGQTARLYVGNVLIVRLPGNPASGYQWQAGTSNTKILRMTVRPQYSPPSAAGASGTYTFIYQAVEAGTGPLRLSYVRPNDANHPRENFAIGVSVSPSAGTAPARSAARATSPGQR